MPRKLFAKYDSEWEEAILIPNFKAAEKIAKQAIEDGYTAGGYQLLALTHLGCAESKFNTEKPHIANLYWYFVYYVAARKAWQFSPDNENLVFAIQNIPAFEQAKQHVPECLAGFVAEIEPQEVDLDASGIAAPGILAETISLRA